MRKELVPTTEEHIHYLAENMRQPDIDEVWAAARISPLEGLQQSVASTAKPITGLINGEVACLYGLGSPTILSTIGVPWLLTSHVVDKHPLAFLRGCRQYFEEQTRGFDILVNFVDARHTAAKHWIRWLGFTIHPAEPYGPFGYPFHKFERTF